MSTPMPDANENPHNTWDRIISVMIRQMIRQFLAHPSEFLTFRRLSRLMNGIDADILCAVAKQRSDLFLVTQDDRYVKLFSESVERIIHDGIGRVMEEVGSVPYSAMSQHDRNHYQDDSYEGIIPDLIGCSLSAEMLVSSSDWRQICRLRGLHRDKVDDETWREICRIRGYLLARQNSRGS
jgi:hypothetical protein